MRCTLTAQRVCRGPVHSINNAVGIRQCRHYALVIVHPRCDHTRVASLRGRGSVEDLSFSHTRVVFHCAAYWFSVFARAASLETRHSSIVERELSTCEVCGSEQ